MTTVGINATYQGTTTLIGTGIGPGAAPLLQDSQQTTPTNTNAPPPTSLVTTGAFQTVAVPSGYTVSRAQIMAPAGSTNAKTLKGITGDTGLPGWTGGSVTIPVVAGSSFGITSTVSGEALIIAYS